MAHKILVVDDQPFMVRLIQHHLEKAGFELIKARNPQEAKAAFTRETPQLVVMSEHAGTTTEPYSLPAPPKETPPIPVIRMTDVPASMPQQKSESGNEVVFRKPFSPTKFVAEIRRLLPEIKTVNAGEKIEEPS